MPFKTSSALPTAAIPRVSREKAAALIDRLLSGYPSLNPHDAQGYLTTLVNVLLSYSEPVAIAAAKHVADNCKFPPARAELHEACEAEAGREERMSRYRSFRPSVSVSRGDPGPDPEPDEVDPAGRKTGKHRAGTVLANFDAAMKLYGRPVGPFEDGRERPYKAHQAPARSQSEAAG